jgi:8-oxo-dGTP pyrophosphatase MutT (NUDIX family)
VRASGRFSQEFAEFVARLERRLAQPLPGVAAQLPMAPRPRHTRPVPDVDPEHPIPAAVLALLFPAGEHEPTVDGFATKGEPCLVLTRRSEHVESHKGQICLPGGALDSGESALDAALREADEEVGLARDGVRVLGRLTSLYIPVSGFRIEPFVAATDRRPTFRAAADEVDELIEISLTSLLDPARRGERHATRDEHPVVVPYFEIAGRHVWGATAMILAELCKVLEEA